MQVTNLKETKDNLLPGQDPQERPDILHKIYVESSKFKMVFCKA